MLPLRHPNTPPLHALLLWQTCGLAYVIGLTAVRWPLPALICLACLFWADSRLCRFVPGLLALCLCVLGFVVCYICLPKPTPLPAWTQTTPPVRLTATVVRVQGLPDARLRIFLENARPVHTPADSAIQSLVWTWDTPTQRPLPGQHIDVTLPVRAITGFRNPGVSDSGEWWAAQGVFARLWSRGATGNPVFYGTPFTGAAARDALASKLIEVLGQGGPLTQAQAFLPALLFGDRSHLHTHTIERMAGAGLSHSLALSGQHLALVALLALIITRLLARSWPQIYLTIPRLKLVALLSLPLALLYLWLGGVPASLVRASCMLAFMAVFLWRDSLCTPMDALLAAVLTMTVLWPLGVFDIGFQLSVLCVTALALFAPLLRRVPTLSARDHKQGEQGERGGQWIRGTWRILRTLCLVFLASCVIQIALLPFFLLFFGFVSPWSVLNVIWLPVLGCVVLPSMACGMVLLLMGAETLAYGAFWCAVLPCQGLLDSLDALARLGAFDLPALLRPHWTALPGWAFLMIAVALIPGRGQYPPAGRRVFCAGVLLLCIGPVLRFADIWSDTVRCTVLDVGQGQAVSLRVPGGHTLLIDGGGSLSPRFDPGRDIVTPSLTYNAAPRLQHVFNTHPDMDHSRGLRHIIRAFAVGQFWHNGQMSTIRGQALHTGRVLELGHGLRLEVLHPPPKTAFTGNNASLVLRLVRGEQGLVLLTGDVEVPALHALLVSKQNLRAEVLILPHHGSRSSLLPALYDAVRPKIAVVSCGQGNRYGYPAPEVLHALAALGVPVYTTAQEGAFEIQWNTKGILTVHGVGSVFHAK